MFLALVIFLIIFSFLIISHELGHFLSAKRAGVKVEEFGLGYPPRAWGKRIKGTLYSLNWIPFGGFVRIYGEDPTKDNVQDKKSFYNKPPGIKAVILVSGVLVNILIAILLFYLFLGVSDFKTYQSQLFDYQFPFGEQKNYPAVSYVVADSPAEKVGIKPYDLILSFNGKPVEDIHLLVDKINKNQGQEAAFLLKNLNTGERREVLVKLRANPTEEQGALGVALAEVSELQYSGAEKIFAGFIHSANLTHFSFSALGYLIKVSVAERDITPLSQSVAGPVGIFAFTKMTMAAGFWQIINLVAIISLALAIVNILPIPAADGGRLMFVLYEVVFGKKAPPALERNVNLAGFVILIILLFLVTYKDIVQFKDILF